MLVNNLLRQVVVAMLWALFLVSSMSIIPRCTCHDGVFRVPLTLKHDYNATAMYSLHVTHEVSKHHVPTKNKQKAVVEITHSLTGPIVLGGQQFKVVFDSGSDDLWVFGNDVNKEHFREDGHDHQYYNYMDASTTGATGEPFEESYGAVPLFTRVSGVYELNTLNIGGIEVDPYRFGVVNQIETGEMVNMRHDGIMGLGYQAKGIPSSKESAFTSMVRQRLLHLPMFSVYMSEDSVRGEILFGSWDDRYFKYPFEVNNAYKVGEVGHGFWIVKVTKLALGEAIDDVGGGGGVVGALVDTGCSNLHLTPELLNKVREDSKTLDDALDRESENYGYVTCSSRRSLPTLKITIGSRVYVLTGEEYTSPRRTITDSEGQELCRLEMDDGVPHRTIIVIGGPFFRKYYTMFFHEYAGYEGPVVAFAEAKHPPRGA